MITKENFEIGHIKNIQQEYKNDLHQLERTLFAFGLLEAISKTEMPFIFKGGTCLLLLLQSPMRISTDIDIVVPPQTDINSYIQKAGQIFPFFHVEEIKREPKSNIEKRHFKFLYISPTKNAEITVLLDVLFEENLYTSTIQKTLENKLLLTSGENQIITIPSINCILGDKLTAFAPHTVGKSINEYDLEIIKQMFDCATLFNEHTDFSEVKETYNQIVKTEIAYRGLDILPSQVLKDTIFSAASIVSKGFVNPEDFSVYNRGINAIRSHIFGGKYGVERAALEASKVMYLASCVLADKDTVENIADISTYQNVSIEYEELKNLSKIKKVYREAYAYCIAALENCKGLI